MPKEIISKKMQAVLDTIKLAPKEQGITGKTISIWLGHHGKSEPVRESLKALVRRGLITMTAMDDTSDQWRQQFPDYMIAVFKFPETPNPQSGD